MCTIVIGSGIILALGEFYNWDECDILLLCIIWPMLLLASPLIAIGFASYKITTLILEKLKNEGIWK
jgi:hypothetical protein